MYAVVKSGGKQYKVEEGSELVVERLDAGVGDSVDFDVLFFSDGTDVMADPSVVSTASVTAEVVEQFKGDKVIVFKFKKRKGYKRTKGHRQQLTRVKVTGMSAPTGKAKKKVEPKPAAKPKTEPKTAAPKAEAKVEKPAVEPKPAAKPKTEPKPAAPKAEKPAAAPAAEPGQCEAIKADGDRCSNKAKDGSKYCGVHAKKYDG